MDLLERTTFFTPEGVAYSLPIAGVGSRFAACLVDLMAQLLAAVAASAFSSGDFESGNWITAISTIVTFLIVSGYPFIFEAFFGGRTIGKAIIGIRVVDVSGSPMSVAQSAVRNLIRVVDFLPMLYIIGLGSLVASPRNQRLGDVAANTLVVVQRNRSPRTRRAKRAKAKANANAAGVALGASKVDAATMESISHWDVTAVSLNDVGIISQFLARRASLGQDVRERIGQDFANRIRPGVIGSTDGLTPEELLERVVLLKQIQRGR